MAIWVLGNWSSRYDNDIGKRKQRWCGEVAAMASGGLGQSSAWPAAEQWAERQRWYMGWFGAAVGAAGPADPTAT